MQNKNYNPRFTEEVDFYTVVILNLVDFKPSQRKLPDGITISGSEIRNSIRKQEKKILQRTFDDWYIPYEGKLVGWRSASPIYAMHGERLIGGIYLCERNMFDDRPNFGQLHYFFMDPEYRGIGVHSILFTKAVELAHFWGLSCIYVNSDRYILPDVYIRWGAQPYKTISKSSRLPQNRLGKLLWPFKVSFRNFLRRIRSL